MSAPPNLASAFDTFTSIRLESPILEEIWRESFADDYAEEARPNAFYPKSVLDRITDAISYSASNGTLLDIGCGHGLTALHIANQVKMSVFGIDISPASIALAQVQVKPANVKDVVFWVADATFTGLEDSACDAVTCLDVLLYFPDKAAALKEISRILKPGGLFAFTTWEQTGYNERIGAAQVADYRPLLVEAGYTVKTYEAVDGAREVQNRFSEILVQREAELKANIGEKAASMLVNMAKSASAERSSRRYVFGIAERQA